MSAQAVKVVGISIENGKFHLRSSGNSKIGVWLDPGEASFKMVKLPHGMTKFDAIKYLKEQKDFQNKKIQAFLDQQYDRKRGKSIPKRRRIDTQLRQMVEEVLRERLLKEEGEEDAPKAATNGHDKTAPLD